MIKDQLFKALLLFLLSSSLFAGTNSLTCQDTIIIDSPLYGVVAFTLSGGSADIPSDFNGQTLSVVSSNNLTEESSGGPFEFLKPVVLQVSELDTITTGGYSEERYAVELRFTVGDVYPDSFWAVCTMGSLTGTFGF